jgi:hypothetical protein
MMITGVPLSELELDPKQLRQRQDHEGTSKQARGGSVLQRPNSIVFFRRRMLYARAALNAQGRVRFGLKHTRTWNFSFSIFTFLN